MIALHHTRTASSHLKAHWNHSFKKLQTCANNSIHMLPEIILKCMPVFSLIQLLHSLWAYMTPGMCMESTHTDPQQKKTTKPGIFTQFNGIYTLSYLTSCFECTLRRSEVVWRPKPVLPVPPRSNTQCIGHACSMAPYARVGGRARLWS